MGRSRIGGQPPGESDVHGPGRGEYCRTTNLVVDNRLDLVKVVVALVVGQKTYRDARGPIYDVSVTDVRQAGHVDWPWSSSANETSILKPSEYLFDRRLYLYEEFHSDRSSPTACWTSDGTLLRPELCNNDIVLDPYRISLIRILLPRFLNLKWMAERRWQAVICIRCFTRRRFSNSRKNCMGVILGGTSRMTVPRNSTVLRAAIVVDPAEPT
ncbi:hypothetical protein Tco_1370456 [Tanacetum coccineum]